MAEAHEQIVVVEYCELKRIPIFAIPNGGTRNRAEAANLVRQGVKKGVPDLFLPVAKGGYHGLFIEMKYGKGKPSKYQNLWIELLNRNGYLATVCWGADEAIKVIEKYIRS